MSSFLLRDVVERESTIEAPSMSSVKDSGFPKPTRRFISRSDNKPAPQTRFRVELGGSSSISVSQEDLDRLAWTDRFITEDVKDEEGMMSAPFDEDSDLSASEVLKFLSSSFGQQKVAALRKVLSASESDPILKESSLPVRLAVLCSSNTPTHTSALAWQCLARLTARSGDIAEEISSIPEFTGVFMRLASFCLKNPTANWAEISIIHAISVFTDILRILDNKENENDAIEIFFEIFEEFVLPVALGSCSGSDLLASALNPGNFLSDELLEPLCLAAVTRAFLEEKKFPGSPEERAAVKAVDLWVAGQGLPENLRVFGLEISRFFKECDGVSDLTIALLNLLGMFRDHFNSKDCLSSLLSGIGGWGSRPLEIQAADKMIVEFPLYFEEMPHTFSEFSERLWRNFQVLPNELKDPASRVIAYGCSKVFFANEILPSLDGPGNLYPSAMYHRAADLFNRQDLAEKALRLGAIGDLSKLWKIVGSCKLSRSPSDTVVSGSEEDLLELFDLPGNFFSSDSELFSNLCDRVIGGKGLTVLRSVVELFKRSRGIKIDSEIVWDEIAYSVIGAYSENGGDFGGMMTFGFCSLVFPETCRLAVWSDPELINNIARSAVSKEENVISFTSGPVLEEYSSEFKGEFALLVKSRIKEFIDDWTGSEDNFIFRVANRIVGH